MEAAGAPGNRGQVRHKKEPIFKKEKKNGLLAGTGRVVTFSLRVFSFSNGAHRMELIGSTPWQIFVPKIDQGNVCCLPAGQEGRRRDATCFEVVPRIQSVEQGVNGVRS